MARHDHRVGCVPIRHAAVSGGHPQSVDRHTGPLFPPVEVTAANPLRAVMTRVDAPHTVDAMTMAARIHSAQYCYLSPLAASCDIALWDLLLIASRPRCPAPCGTETQRRLRWRDARALRRDR